MNVAQLSYVNEQEIRALTAVRNFRRPLCREHSSRPHIVLQAKASEQFQRVLLPILAVQPNEEEQMPQRCHTCKGRFGLVRHYHFRLQFCSIKCKKAYMRTLAPDLGRIKAWQAWLQGG